MSDFIVRTSEQLPALLQAFRKQAGLTQAEAAVRLGVTQQTMSALERNAERVSAGRLMKLLSILGVELVLRKDDLRPGTVATSPTSSNPTW
jgi:HTH-type transcriptional regulator/antitoxin HipB